MSFDNSFDRHDLHDPSQERHDDPRDGDPYYGYERKRPSNRRADFLHQQREIDESRAQRLARLQMYRLVFVKRIYFDSSDLREYFD